MMLQNPHFHQIISTFIFAVLAIRECYGSHSQTDLHDHISAAGLIPLADVHAFRTGNDGEGSREPFKPAGEHGASFPQKPGGCGILAVQRGRLVPPGRRLLRDRPRGLRSTGYSPPEFAVPSGTEPTDARDDSPHGPARALGSVRGQAGFSRATPHSLAHWRRGSSSLHGSRQGDA